MRLGASRGLACLVSSPVQYLEVEDHLGEVSLLSIEDRFVPHSQHSRVSQQLEVRVGVVVVFPRVRHDGLSCRSIVMFVEIRVTCLDIVLHGDEGGPSSVLQLLLEVVVYLVEARVMSRFSGVWRLIRSEGSMGPQAILLLRCSRLRCLTRLPQV